MSAKESVVEGILGTQDCGEMVEESERRSSDRDQARAEEGPKPEVDKNPVKLLEETRQLLELAKSVRQFAAQNPVSVFKKDENGNNSTKRMEEEEDSMEVQVFKKAKSDDQDEKEKDIYFDGVTFKKLIYPKWT